MKKSFFLSLLTIPLFLQFTQAQKTKKEDKQPLDSINVDGLKWRSIDPSITPGKISDIAINPNNPYAL